MKIVNDTCFSRHEFEVVDKIPHGYIVWNIGHNMNAGYIPLAEVEDNQINPNTLKAIALDDEEVRILRNAAHYGVNDLESARKSSRIESPKTYLGKRKQEFGALALPIFERITE